MIVSPAGPPRSLLDPALLERIDLSEADRRLERALVSLSDRRLGARFERIQEALFALHPDTRSLRANLVIPGRTEIDLLQETAERVFIHWEVAVKFYLGLDPRGSEDPDRWIGPGQKDSLGAKLRAIRTRQLPALESSEARSLVGLTPEDRVLAAPKVHGILFLPMDSAGDGTGAAKIARPEGVGAAAIRGVWAPLSRLEESLERTVGPAGVRLLADRNEWIQDQRYVSGSPWISPSAPFCAHVRGRVLGAGPTMIASSRDDLRLFVVPDDWAARGEAAVDTIRGRGRIES